MAIRSPKKLKSVGSPSETVLKVSEWSWLDALTDIKEVLLLVADVYERLDKLDGLIKRNSRILEPLSEEDKAIATATINGVDLLLDVDRCLDRLGQGMVREMDEDILDHDHPWGIKY